jgi:CHAD domain.
MERKIWLKPAEGAKIGAIKSVSEKSGEASLLECLFLDTADTDLLSSSMVLMISAGPEGLKQTVAVENQTDGTSEEYACELPLEGVDLSLFPKEVYQKLQAVLQGKRLQVHFASAFEEKTRLVAAGEGERYVMERLLGRFEDDDLKGELYAIELKSADGQDAPPPEYAAKLAAEAKLERCASPWFEAMRIKTSGFQPAITEKKLKKYVDARIMQPLSLRLFELVKAYIALNSYSFERTAIHRLRVEARKMMSVIEAFAFVYGEKADGHTSWLQKLLDDTDEAHRADLLDEEVGMIFALNPKLDFSALQQRLTEKRTRLKEQIKSAYEKGAYSPGLISLWTDTHEKTHTASSSEENDVTAAVARVREWIVQLNTFKKSGMSDPDTVCAYRVLLRKVRYALDNMEELIPRRASKAAAGLKKIQDEFGMLSDVNQHMGMLHELAAESGDAEFAYYCGICSGIFSGCRQEIHREALDVWKGYRSDIRSLEDAL